MGLLGVCARACAGGCPQLCHVGRWGAQLLLIVGKEADVAVARLIRAAHRGAVSAQDRTEQEQEGLTHACCIGRTSALLSFAGNCKCLHVRTCLGAASTQRCCGRTGSLRRVGTLGAAAGATGSGCLGYRLHLGLVKARCGGRPQGTNLAHCWAHLRHVAAGVPTQGCRLPGVGPGAQFPVVRGRAGAQLDLHRRSACSLSQGC